VSVAGGNAVVIVRASLAQTLLRLPSRRTGARRASTHRRGMRCDVLSLTRVNVIRIAGALRLRDFRPAVVMQTGINSGDSNPKPFRPAGNDLTGRCNRGSRTLDRAVVSCLLSRLSYIAVADMVTSDAGTRAQHGCRVPVWLQPQPLASDVNQDLGDDERSSRSSNSSGCGRRTYSGASAGVNLFVPISQRNRFFAASLQHSSCLSDSRTPSDVETRSRGIELLTIGT
jgi:hypothetical protein